MLAADFDLLAQAHESMADLLNDYNRETVLFVPTRAALQLRENSVAGRDGVSVELAFIEHQVPTILYRLAWTGSAAKAREVQSKVPDLMGPSLPYWEGAEDPYSIFETVWNVIAEQFKYGQVVITDGAIIFERLKHVLRKKKLHLAHSPEHKEFQLSYVRGQYFVNWLYNYTALVALNDAVRKKSTPPTPPGEQDG